MKVFFSLILFSLMLATCQGTSPLLDFCTGSIPLPEKKDGKNVWPNTCVDRFDQQKHLIVSTWKTAQCFSCECRQDGMWCCKKYSGDAKREGCITVANPETCQYDHRCVGPPMEAAA